MNWREQINGAKGKDAVKAATNNQRGCSYDGCPGLGNRPDKQRSHFPWRLILEWKSTASSLRIVKNSNRCGENKCQEMQVVIAKPLPTFYDRFLGGI
jgi:hypothetical protein